MLILPFDNKMRPILIFVFLFAGAAILKATQTFTVEDVGVSIRVPDDWRHDETDTFGYVLRPINDTKRKIRIHLTAHKNISPEEAVKRSAEKIKEIRNERTHGPEDILSSKPLTTASSIKGQKAIVGQQGIDGPSYLDRYYFERPDGRIFCVCVYHFSDPTFSRDAEEVIMETLSFKKSLAAEAAAQRIEGVRKSDIPLPKVTPYDSDPKARAVYLEEYSAAYRLVLAEVMGDCHMAVKGSYENAVRDGWRDGKKAAMQTYPEKAARMYGVSLEDYLRYFKDERSAGKEDLDPTSRGFSNFFFPVANPYPAKVTIAGERFRFSQQLVESNIENDLTSIRAFREDIRSAKSEQAAKDAQGYLDSTLLSLAYSIMAAGQFGAKSERLFAALQSVKDALRNEALPARVVTPRQLYLAIAEQSFSSDRGFHVEFGRVTDVLTFSDLVIDARDQILWRSGERKQ